MKKLFSLLLLFSTCHTTSVLTPEATSPKHLHLDSLLARNLSEDMSRISTHEDEIYCLVFISNEGNITQNWRSPQSIFTRKGQNLLLSHHFNNLEPDERCTFFLIELDNETLPERSIQLMNDWVNSTNFPQDFQLLRADSLLGNDDILGMQSFLLRNTPASPLTFAGRQLFDAFHYELYFSVE